MLRAQIDQETTPNDTSALRSRGGRQRNVSGGATRDGFSMRSDSVQDPEQDSDEALASGPGGFIEVLTPLAGQMAFEIVTALFANHREMEGAYADLKRMLARIRTSDKKEWHGILNDLIAFMQKRAPMLPDMARSKVTAVWKLFRELGAMLFELFFPFTYPFNPAKLNFRGLILKNRSLVKLRSPDELLSDTRLIKGFLENVFLPPSIATLAKAPVKPQGTVVRVGPDLFRSQLVLEVGEQPHAIYYIKVGDLYYAIGWDTNFDLAVLADSHSPFPSYLRRRFADWVENTSPRRGGGAASPTWADAGFDPTSERARGMVMELRVAKSDALDMLQQARETATSDASDIQEKVKQAFEIFLNDASRSTIRSFANNLSAIIDFLREISAASDVAFLNDKTGNRLSAMPGSAFDIAVTYDPAAAIYREDVEAKHIQKMDAITGPGIINDTDNAGFLQYPTRDHIIPLSMQDDQFDVGHYTFDVTAHLVRANEFCRSVIREGFVATTKNKRIARKWIYLTTTAEPNLAKMSAADKQVFFDQLSQTYGMFVFEGQPLEARPSAAFANAGARGWDRTGEEVGIDISSLLNTARTPAKGESVTAARVADPDQFSFLVIVLSDIKADPPRFEDFTARVAESKPSEQLLLRWFKKDSSA